MRVNVLKSAGPYEPGVHEVPERNAKALIHSGYAEPVTGDIPALAGAERAAQSHGTGRGRGRKREVRG